MNFYRQGDDLRAVRPENLRIERHLRNGGGLAALIGWVEFRGASTRVHARLEEGTEICVDLPTEQADRLAVRQDDLVYLHPAAGRVAHYAAPAAAA